jgi:hypothetical protein
MSSYIINAYGGVQQTPVYDPSHTMQDYQLQIQDNNNTKYNRIRPGYKKGWTNTTENITPIGAQNTRIYKSGVNNTNRNYVDMYVRQPFEYDAGMNLRSTPIKYKTYNSMRIPERTKNQRTGYRHDLFHQNEVRGNDILGQNLSQNWRRGNAFSDNKLSANLINNNVESRQPVTGFRQPIHASMRDDKYLPAVARGREIPIYDIDTHNGKSYKVLPSDKRGRDGTIEIGQMRERNERRTPSNHEIYGMSRMKNYNIEPPKNKPKKDHNFRNVVMARNNPKISNYNVEHSDRGVERNEIRHCRINKGLYGDVGLHRRILANLYK